MAVAIPRTSSTQSLFERGGGLRRSHASTGQLNMYLPRNALSSSPEKDEIPDLFRPEPLRQPTPPSSLYPEPPSSVIPKTDLAARSTPNVGRLSLEDKYSSSDEEFGFSDYTGLQFYQTNESYPESQSSEDPVESTTTETTASDSPLPTPTVVDDTAIKQEPKQHVDYLSHDWREEDIWSSWRHIVSQRRVYGQRSRLENASWRTWAKSKYALRTISPETLNWLKESDVTWLYGPLKLAESHPITSNQSAPDSQLSKSNSFIAKKPILKKRSMSEVMLQRSISGASLLKQAADSIQAQQGKQPHSAFRRARSDFTTTGFDSKAPSRDQIDYFTSRGSSSECSTPCDTSFNRHIRFDETVEVMAAVEYKDDEANDSESDEEEQVRRGSDSSSDDGVIMMKRKKRARNPDGKGSRSSSQSRKMIETLPSDTLKYRTDSPDVTDVQQHHTFGKNWGASRLSPSPSQETLRPSRPSANFLLPEDDPEPAETSTWSFGASNPKSSLGEASSSEEEALDKRSRRKNRMTAAKSRAATPAPDEYSNESLRRTNSGMLMPYDEDEDDAMAVGLFGKVSETINTAKDIAHVIWNVGWRK